MTVYCENVMVCDVFKAEFKNKETGIINYYPRMIVYSAVDKGLFSMSVPEKLFDEMKKHLGSRLNVYMLQRTFENHEKGTSRISYKLERFEKVS